ncbi:hypothetical protein SWPG_00200 [Synechococcus phage S-CBM2]|nr:hypothetical protein SWPG_00200 [Synechococcus phage S-CBM2]
MNPETKLILALQQVDNLTSLLKGNEYERFLFHKLIGVQVELQRQLSHYTHGNS